jgi:hypothetical protein
MNKVCFPLIRVCFLVFLFSGCQKEKTVERDYPQIRTLAVDHITGDGARFNAVITGGSAESVSEYGFVWGTSSILNLQHSEKIIVNGPPPSDNFSCEITFALESMNGYYVRSYIKSGMLVIYGDIVNFRSLGSMAPEITDFEPKAATWGDTITIYGNNFSFQKTSNVIYFGEAACNAVEATNVRLRVVVPGYLGNFVSDLSVEVSGNIAVALETFELLTPGKIVAIDRIDVAWGDTLELTGIFPFSTNDIKLLISNEFVELIETTPVKISAIVPGTLVYKDSISIFLFIDGHRLPAPGKCHMIKPYINVVEPTEFGWGDTIGIQGLFFPQKNGNSVVFSTVASTILDVTRDKIRCIVPDAGLLHQATLKVISGNFELAPVEVSLSGPIIERIIPAKIVSDAYATIVGKYFRSEVTSLTINGVGIGLYVTSSRSMNFTMPAISSRGPASVTVRVYDKQNTYNDLLFFVKPVITDFNPKEGTFGDVITVSGEDFDPEDIAVSLTGYDYSSDLIEKSPNLIRFAVSNMYTTKDCRIFIKTMGTTTYSDVFFHVFSPRLDLITPIQGKPGDIVRIDGYYFNPQSDLNTVYVGGYQAIVTNSSRSYIEFFLPGIPVGSHPVVVGNGSSTTTYGENFQYLNP